MYQTIMVPLDGTPFSEQALPWATYLAQANHARLALARVHSPILPISFGNVPMGEIPTQTNVDLDTEKRAAERAYLQETQQSLAHATGLKVESALLDGVVVKAIMRQAATTQADCIVMTTHGHGPLARMWLGSVADACVRHSSVPVLLVRPDEAGAAPVLPAATPRILVPLDGSPLAEAILPHALSLGEALQAHYLLLQVIDPLVLGYAPAAHAYELDEQVMAQARAGAIAYLERVAEPLRRRGVQATCHVVTGAAAASILHESQTHHINFIAVATHGRSGISRLVLGSVADKVIRGATMPVLVVHPQQQG